VAQGVPNKVNQPIRKGGREEKTNEGTESSKSQITCWHNRREKRKKDRERPEP
jgi:hypothetical protein